MMAVSFVLLRKLQGSAPIAQALTTCVSHFCAPFLMHSASAAVQGPREGKPSDERMKLIICGSIKFLFAAIEVEECFQCRAEEGLRTGGSSSIHIG